MVDMTNEQELAASSYWIDDQQHTRILVFGIPYALEQPLAGSPSLKFRIEGSLGYMEATGAIEDAFEGALPGFELGYDARWTAWSALAGAGIVVPVVDGLTVTPLLSLSTSYVRSEASYSGGGAPILGQALDGILFNWSATTVGVGAALRARYQGRIADDIDYEVLTRYDSRLLETVHSTDAAQDFDEITRYLTTRLTVAGPTGLTLGAYPLDWTTHVGYRRFFSDTAEALGFRDFGEVGGTLELTGLAWPSGVTLFASILRGAEVSGWTAGLSLTL